MTTSQAAGSARLDTMVAADDQFPADELNRLGAARRRVCDATVRRLEQLLGTARAGAPARVELDSCRGELLRDGALLWTARRTRRCAAPTLSTSVIDGTGTGTGTVTVTVVPA